MSAKDQLTNQQQRTTNDQEHETSPPGGMIDADAGLPRQAGWQGDQQSATALKKQQETDLGVVKDVAAKSDSGGIGEGNTFDSKT